ncbi:MAG: aminomethyl-transferring glycine dehydrogenase [Pseudomonadota bacterium]
MTLEHQTNESDFISRHIGPDVSEVQGMLNSLSCLSIDALIEQVVPQTIASSKPLAMDAGVSETQALAELRAIASRNIVMKSLIGQGYYNTHTPNVVLRNVLENPGWYTAYTPYQPEISQGRLEALLNFQTMVTDLTGMDLANASLLDEATAAAEAMTLCRRVAKSKGDVFFVDRDCLPQTIDVVQTRAAPLGLKVVVGDPHADLKQHQVFGVLLQYPGASGEVRDLTAVIDAAHEQKALAVVAADLLALMLLRSPGAMGADVAIGSTQRFGVPLGFGGPHAAYLATQEKFKRSIPGRIVGVSIDSHGKQVYRLALQTREQHIRRESATSNICTAQVLLAVIAGMYAVYHGPERLRQIAARVHELTRLLASGLRHAGVEVGNQQFFDTLTIKSGADTSAIHQRCREHGINLREIDATHLGVSLDETVEVADVATLLACICGDQAPALDVLDANTAVLDQGLLREDAVLTHPVFNSYHSETEMLRYLRRLADKDIALDRAMIPLGSCTMKLNATAEMLPITWSEFAGIHPFVPRDQTLGYQQMIDELCDMLCASTGYQAVSLQPNAGSQGEYAGLLAISAYHANRGEAHRNVCLIPSSAHGTNPASAKMVDMDVVVVKCDSDGNIDIDDLKAKCETHSEQLAAIMITYPSTHGVFEEHVREVCDLVHQHGGQVYMDGANLNAMVGLCYPGEFGGDVSHLNLHKTFCIPHGGGGPGVGPVAVAEHLAEFLPGHRQLDAAATVGAVSAAPWGSAGILPISWMYIKMMGGNGLKRATEIAILNANYIAQRLKDHYPVLYTGAMDRVAHECIIDLRDLKERCGIQVDDVAKRLIDYGFHAPTMSFPVAGTLMIEPTESESKAELDRFCDAMIAIRGEIEKVEQGVWSAEDNPLVNAPHPADVLMADAWPYSYGREQAGFPVASLREAKYWPPVGRIDQVYGDRNLVCSCPPLSAYEA